MNFSIQDARFRLQNICESIDGIYLEWENRLEIYINMLEEKFGQ